MNYEEFKMLQDNIVKGKKGKPQSPLATVIKIAAPIKATRLKKGSKAKGEMEFVLMALYPDYKKEFRFAAHIGRQYRFDFCIPELKIGIEYEGIVAFKSKGEYSRHTHIDGFTEDSRKYNLAQILGYKVLRYTTLSYKELITDLEKLKKYENI